MSLSPGDHAFARKHAWPGCVWRHFSQLSVDALYAVLAMRQRVFVIEQKCLYLDADGVDPQCWHGLACSDAGVLRAYARIVPPGVCHAQASIGRVLVDAPYRGGGAGWALMASAMQQAARLYPGQPVRISAQLRLERFYCLLGFVPSGQPYDDAGIAHIDMLHTPQASRAGTG